MHPQVCLQHDHHSLYVLNWLGGAWHMRLADSLVRPLMGAGLVAQGRAADLALVSLLETCAFRVPFRSLVLQRLRDSGAQQLKYGE